MIVVGGTYDEVCFEPKWDYKFGSGLRAIFTIQNINNRERLKFYTFGNANTKLYLESLQDDYLELAVQDVPYTVRFNYDYPLSVPRISPRLDIISQESLNFNIGTDDNLLYYGMIEGSAQVNANRVVYDPQSPANPKSFSSTGSYAKELAIVTNISEAKLLAKSNDLESIIHHFFNEEQVSVLVLKMGPLGALVCTTEMDRYRIPVYITENVWPIGSGDVFAASFAYYWFKGNDSVQAAKYASWNTACYCNSRAYSFSEPESGGFKPLLINEIPDEQVYLAGPFFTFTQRWLIHQIYLTLKGMGLKVFSPWHDVGHGEASFVVPLDLQGLNNSKLVFAVLDGLDSGTLFEVGYANAKGIEVVGYVESESDENIKMLVGTNCQIERDLATAVYKIMWKLLE